MLKYLPCVSILFLRVLDLKLMTIESKENATIKHLVKLAENKRYRTQNKQAVIYGEHLIIEAIKKNLLNSLFVSENSYERYVDIFANLGFTVYKLNVDVVKKINVLDTVFDIVAIINLPIEQEINFSLDSLVLENIQDPGNLGTILRVAKASGINQVILSNDSVDVYNPKVLRSSQGIQFGLSIHYVDNLVDVLEKLKTKLLALTPHTDNSIYEIDFSKPTTFVFGNEGNGISQELLEKIESHVTIPMHGDTESLNLAMAVTIAAFELSRQRSVINKSI